MNGALSNRAAQWLGCMCVAVVLIATLAQAVHFCDSMDFPAGVTVKALHGSSCPICATAHSVPLAAPYWTFSPVANQSARAAIPAPADLAGPTYFALHVRPPPVA